ncbi:hypothetical protein [Actinomyces sp. MRS3W]|uniref:hypothetical protein n=1 Tax=Actinomyces sp. MRS3W TaxID=2800796 RepID=UPI0028FD4774|nr:hypothetical protein [Actinomyces sp. MRS3W]MDU0348563.1 hypothetical protein [Actinomyces sp. MRS3W]
MDLKKMHNRNIRSAATSLLLAGSLALTLAACGSSDSTTSTDESSASSEAVAVETTVAPDGLASPDVKESTNADATESTDADGDSDADSAAEATPAPEGVMISAMAGRDLPEKVGDYTNTGNDGVADQYKLHEEDGVFDSISVEFREGMDYAGAIENLSNTVPGGTGLCGTNPGSDNPVCYLQTTDGTVVITSDVSFISVEELAAFGNELTAELGTE